MSFSDTRTLDVCLVLSLVIYSLLTSLGLLGCQGIPIYLIPCLTDMLLHLPLREHLVQILPNGNRLLTLSLLNLLASTRLVLVDRLPVILVIAVIGIAVVKMVIGVFND